MPEANTQPARRKTVASLSIAAAALLGGVLVANVSNGQSAPMMAPFTDEQAERGFLTFFADCAGCHGADQLAGALERAENSWTFFSFISGNMPYDGSPLPAQSYVDIIAFLYRELGLPAGDAELLYDRDVLVGIAPRQVALQLAQVDTAEVGAWYTAEQADRGLRAFTLNCGGCHGAEAPDTFTEYATAAAYFSFISGAMPADNPGNLAIRDYVDIIAYMMREKGFPAGDVELTNDRTLLEQIVPAAAIN